MTTNTKNEIWELDLPATAKLVLLCIDDMSNIDGVAQLSLQSLCHLTGCSKGSLAYTLKALEIIGVISREQQTTDSGKDTHTIYTINNINSVTKKIYQDGYQKARTYKSKSAPLKIKQTPIKKIKKEDSRLEKNIKTKIDDVVVDEDLDCEVNIQKPRRVAWI